MKASTLLTTGKGIVLICFVLFVVLPLVVALAWKVQDWSYTRFCWHGQEYYARIAAACDQLLAAAEPVPRDLKGERLRSLPPILRELDISRVVVDTNLVMVIIGSGLLSHQILWKPAADGLEWNLITSSPETRKRRVIYTKRRAASANLSMQPTECYPFFKLHPSAPARSG